VNKIYDSTGSDWAPVTSITVNYGTDSSTASYYQLHTIVGILSLFTTPAGTSGDLYVIKISSMEKLTYTDSTDIAYRDFSDY